MNTTTYTTGNEGASITLPELQPGEHYAGVILDAQGQVQHHLVLLAAVPTARLNWQDAMAWAESVGGTLPTRQEQSLLFANCQEQFKAEWYWSGEQDGASFAWSCDFGYGYQYYDLKSYEGCARAVRLIPLTA